jgi:hypothetical protein
MGRSSTAINFKFGYMLENLNTSAAAAKLPKTAFQLCRTAG